MSELGKTASKKSKARRKKAPKPLSAVKAAKSAARATLGTPRPVIRHQSKQDRKQPKHKPTFSDLLAEGE